MAGPSPKPIVSTRADDPNVAERIDVFVVELGRRIDDLQDLEADARFPELIEQVVRFGEEALELGYAPLSDTARLVAAACRENSPDAIRKSLTDLTELSRLVRSGHRGAA